MSSLRYRQDLESMSCTTWRSTSHLVQLIFPFSFFMHMIFTKITSAATGRRALRFRQLVVVVHLSSLHSSPHDSADPHPLIKQAHASPRNQPSNQQV